MYGTDASGSISTQSQCPPHPRASPPQDLFSVYDTDASGSISFDELASGLQQQGYIINESEARAGACHAGAPYNCRLHRPLVAGAHHAALRSRCTAGGPLDLPLTAPSPSLARPSPTPPPRCAS